jgi:hypothetical protein
MDEVIPIIAKPKVGDKLLSAMDANNNSNKPDIEPFLSELTELSRKYKIGIAGDPVLFCLEDEDLDRAYSSDADSKLVY